MTLSAMPHRADCKALPKLFLLGLYALVLLVPPLLGILGAAAGHADDTLGRIGKNLGLIAFAMVAMQFVLSARIRWIERPFGLDAVLRFHRRMGMWAGLFLIIHPLLLALGESGPELLYKIEVPWFIWFGRIALLLVATQVAVTIFRRSIDLKYESWRQLHLVIAAVVLVLAFTHSWSGGGSLGSPAMKAYWIALATTAVGAQIWHRGLRPRNLKRHLYRVRSTKGESHEVATIVLEPDEGGPVAEFLPGQFHFLRAVDAIVDIPHEEHPFTISSCPTERRHFASSIKCSGDFTAKIPKIQEGDRFAIDGPFGRFSYVLHPAETHLIFIAGGIGITPLMSMLRHMRSTHREDLSVTLLYGNTAAEDIVFHRELDEIAESGAPRLEVIHVLSHPDLAGGWNGETGHINREMIAASLPNDLTKTGVYLCAPPGMMSEISGIILDLGVPKTRIHLEAFSY
ncbi:ferredoxin reductase family protein [Haloferula sp.]|uniref:ferredoxin reductase family protein n=1 Tax=Haloferula sp. TaxID=2497595 RepID=UPI003C7699C5